MKRTSRTGAPPTRTGQGTQGWRVWVSRRVQDRLCSRGPCQGRTPSNSSTRSNTGSLERVGRIWTRGSRRHTGTRWGRRERLDKGTHDNFWLSSVTDETETSADSMGDRLSSPRRPQLRKSRPRRIPRLRLLEAVRTHMCVCRFPLTPTVFRSSRLK